MDLKNENVYSDESNLKISGEVIATIVSTTAKDVAGVHAMAAGPVKKLFSKNSECRGVSLEFTEEGVKIGVYIIVKFGVKVNEVGKTVQTRVKEAVETMTGINVASVDVTVAGMKLDTENTDKESE